MDFLAETIGRVSLGIVLPLPEDMAEEVAIVSKRVGEMAGGLDLPVPKNVGEEIARVLTIFRELRSGATADGKVTLKTPSGSLSTAEAIVRTTFHEFEIGIGFRKTVAHS